MLAGQLNILFWQGDDWQIRLEFPDGTDLSDWVFDGQIRDKYDGEVLATMQAVIELPRFAMLKIPRTITAGIPHNYTPDKIPADYQNAKISKLPGALPWDLQLTSPTGLRNTYLWGGAIVVADITDA